MSIGHQEGVENNTIALFVPLLLGARSTPPPRKPFLLLGGIPSLGKSCPNSGPLPHVAKRARPDSDGSGAEISTLNYHNHMKVIC